MSKRSTDVAKKDPRDIQLANCTLTATGIVFRGELSFEDWQGVGEFLERAESGVQWWIGDWLNYGEGRPLWGDKYEQAISMFHRPYDTLAKFKSVSRAIEFCRRRQNLTWGHHYEVAYEEPKVQDELLDWAESDGPDKAPKSVSDLRNQVKRRRLAFSLEAPQLPENKYHTLVVDPPWEMEKIAREVRPRQKGFDYPTMSEQELREFGIAELADETSHLYVWTTQRFLPTALRLIDAWGFEYGFTMVWHKPGGFQPVGQPQYNCEFVLFGRRGSLPFLDTKAFSTCFQAARREHSRKPDEFYDLVRRVSPGPRIDVFSREQREGFSQFGNEAGKFSGAA